MLSLPEFERLGRSPIHDFMLLEGALAPGEEIVHSPSEMLGKYAQIATPTKNRERLVKSIDPLVVARGQLDLFHDDQLYERARYKERVRTICQAQGLTVHEANYLQVIVDDIADQWENRLSTEVNRRIG